MYLANGLRIETVEGTSYLAKALSQLTFHGALNMHTASVQVFDAFK